MSKKFKIKNFDEHNNHLLVEYYDTDVLVDTSTVKTVSLNLSLSNSDLAITSATLANYVSNFFPDKLIYPSQLEHDISYISSTIDQEFNVVASNLTNAKDVTQLINELLNETTSTVTTIN